MHATEAIAAIIDMVPNWYRADHGPIHYGLESDGAKLEFWGHRDPTPSLTSFLRVIRRDIDTVVSRLDPFASSVAADLLQEHFALEWLEISAPGVEWSRVLDYSRHSLQRTYENAEIVFNLVVREEMGSKRISEPSLQKILDPLASSPQTYFQVDRQFRFHSYHEIAWSEITDGDEYEFAPEFLRPFSCLFAVIFDDRNVLAFGAMIKPHADTPGAAGARTTAAVSSFLHGGHPVKVSSDGEITIHFTSRDQDGNEAQAKLEFL